MLLLALWLSYWEYGHLLNFGAQSTAESEPAAVVADGATGDSADDGIGDGADDSTGDASGETDDAEADSDTSGEQADEGGTADSDDTDAANADADDQSADGGSTANQDATLDGSDSTGTEDESEDETNGETEDGAAESESAQDEDADAAGENAAGNRAGGEQISTAPISVILNSTLVVADVVNDTRDQKLRLHAMAAPDSPTRELYESGERFTLIEPSDDFEAYPVVVNGISWVRVRDGNGLIGWADWSLLVSE